jgi:hypothetical protein
MKKTQARHQALIREIASSGELSRRRAKQSVRRLASVGDITFDGDSLIVEVATSELRKATGRRAPYQGQWRPGLASK